MQVHQIKIQLKKCHLTIEFYTIFAGERFIPVITFLLNNKNRPNIYAVSMNQFIP